MKPEWRIAERRIYSARHGLNSLRYARGFFTSNEAMNQPGSPRTLKRVRKAVLSAQGALRNAIGQGVKVGWYDGAMPCQSPFHDTIHGIFSACPQCSGTQHKPGLHRS